MKYYKKSDVHIIECQPEEFSIVMVDQKKKNINEQTYTNAGFFATYHENKKAFTLPVAHLTCDYDASSEYVKKYCNERGKFVGDKFFFDSSKWDYQNPTYQKYVSTFIIENNKPRIEEIQSLKMTYQYAIGGVPVMRDGKDVKFATDVKGQGWGGSSLYATKHIFIGLKKNDDTIYILSYKTKTYNMILTAEAYKKFSSMGFYDVIKLDGGGSHYVKVEGKVVDSMSENRLINNIIVITPSKTTTSKPEPKPTVSESKNPYTMPKTNLRKGSIGSGVKWLQWQLNNLGYDCGKLDGIFGGGTRAQVLKFQKDNKLDADGIVGAKTREALIGG